MSDTLFRHLDEAAIELLHLMFKGFLTLCPAQPLGNLARQMFRPPMRIAEQALVRRRMRSEQVPRCCQRPPDDPHAVGEQAAIGGGVNVCFDDRAIGAQFLTLGHSLALCQSGHAVI
jgi:hypothetical protein